MVMTVQVISLIQLHMACQTEDTIYQRINTSQDRIWEKSVGGKSKCSEFPSKTTKITCRQKGNPALTYPDLRESLLAPARDESEEARGEIPGRVDSIAAVEAEAHADVEDGEAHEERNQGLRNLHVAGVRDGAHADQQQHRAHHLRKAEEVRF